MAIPSKANSTFTKTSHAPQYIRQLSLPTRHEKIQKQYQSQIPTRAQARASAGGGSIKRHVATTLMQINLSGLCAYKKGGLSHSYGSYRYVVRHSYRVPPPQPWRMLGLLLPFHGYQRLTCHVPAPPIWLQVHLLLWLFILIVHSSVACKT